MNSCSPKKTRVVKPLPVQTLQLGQPPRHTNRLVPPKTETNTSYVCSAKGASRGQGNAKERTVKLLKVPPVAVDVTNTVGTAVNEGSPSALNGKELIVAEIPSSGKLVVQELPDVSFGNSELSNYYNDSNDSYHSESNDERNTSDAALTPEKNYKGNNEENINSNLLSSGGIAAEIREERGCTNSKDSDIGDGKHTGYGIAIVDGYDHRDSDSTSNGNEGIKSAVQDDLSEVSVGERASLVVNGFHAPDDDNDSKSSPNSLVCGSKSVPVSGVDIVKAYESVISSKSNSFDASANSFHADTIPMPDAVAITRNDSDDDSVGMGSYATHDDRDFGVVIADALNTPTSRSVLSYEGHQSRADNDNDMNNLSFINLEDSEVVSSVQKKV